MHNQGRGGFAGLLADQARRRGVAGYPGDGTQRWPAVHALDAAVLFRLALESAPAGTSWHAVAAEGDGAPRNWRLDRIEAPQVSDRAGARPAAFSLQAYADQSFGIYQDDVEDVVLRIPPRAAESARRWRFHVNQGLQDEPDGSVVVRFRASGMRELAWHLFTWGSEVEVVAPDRLRTLLVEQLRTALAAHDAAR